MTGFIDLANGYKTAVLALLLLLNLYQFRYLFMLYRHRKISLLLWNLIPAAFVFTAMPFLGNSVFRDSGVLKDLPVAAILLIWLCLVIYTTAAVVSEMRQAKEMLTSNSIKEAFDTLPAGICFFSERGLPVLCNTQMYRLAYQIQGKDLQMLKELQAALDEPAGGVESLQSKEGKTCRLPDGTVWLFSENKTVNENGTAYIQIKAADVTKLHELREKLAERNLELEDMITQVQRVAENMAEITRQQEILTAKMRVHNKMGNCLLSARQYLAQDLPREKKAQFLDLWQDSLNALREEVAAEDEPDACEEVVRIAKSIGVDVQIHGVMPEDDHTAYLLVVALRECVTNALHHAGGTRLDLAIAHGERQVSAVYTNNGKQPTQEITEGGGLSSLRERIERAGGTMIVQSLPCFSLTVTLPEITDRAGKEYLP